MQFLTVIRSVCSGLMCFLKCIGENNEKNGEIICKESFFLNLMSVMANLHQGELES